MMGRSIVAILCVMLPQPVQAQIDPFVHSVLAAEATPGAAIAIVRSGRPPIIRGYGVRSLETGVPVDAHTLFGLASTTKAFTALGLAILADQGRVSWDVPVRQYLPAFRVSDPAVGRDATLVDLLAHRTGTARGDLIWFANPGAQGRELIALLAGLPQARPFRAGFSYSNLMYAAAGEVICVRSGQDWGSFLRHTILRPLGMTDTVVDRALLPPHGNVAGLHAFDGEKMVAFSGSAGPHNDAAAGGLYSSVSDFARWLQFWVDHGRDDDGRRLVSPNAFQALTTIHMPIADRSPTDDILHDKDAPYGYGLGWFIGEYRGHKVLTHSGGGEGVSTLISWMPDQGIGIAIFMNAQGTLGRLAIRNAVFDEALGKGESDWDAQFRPLLAKHRARLNAVAASSMADRQPQLPASRGLAAYAGLYDGGAFGKIEIVRDRQGLVATIGESRRFRLDHWTGERFRVVMDDPEFSWPLPSLISFQPEGGSAPRRVVFEAAGQSATYDRSSR
ncbi:serine hydrolase [Sphingosinicella rhizophila]|uniref:Serine hydrolase n=1 Tax=Sphingosinicella rhizophila TaxID=3050082 RepID=A0ABU3Q5X6_9SPHN|nr:serine hydrolase [Sphingosinicella sp. GR2756]MDT9598809.1 serine hydrolase [Sphingosinicella sp. GR2756]